MLFDALWVLVVYLWISGGIGWVLAYEKGHDTRLTAVGRTLVVVLSPVFFLFAVIEMAEERLKASMVHEQPSGVGENQA